MITVVATVARAAIRVRAGQALGGIRWLFGLTTLAFAVRAGFAIHGDFDAVASRSITSAVWVSASLAALCAFVWPYQQRVRLAAGVVVVSMLMLWGLLATTSGLPRRWATEMLIITLAGHVVWSWPWRSTSLHDQMTGDDDDGEL